MNPIDQIRSLIFKDKTPLLEINSGIGDILLCYTYAIQLLEKFDRVRIRVNYGLLYYYRNHNTYSESLHEFTRGLASAVFSDNRFELVDTPLDTGPIQGHDYPALLGLKFKPCDISHILIDDSIKLKSPYLVINVKIRNYPKFYHSLHLPNLIQYLNLFNGKIVLVGDRSIDYHKNTEYAGHESSRYSIYAQLISAIKPSRILDLTQENLMHEPNLEKFMYEYSLVKNADEVIQIGVSGSYLISLLLNPKTKVVVANDSWEWLAKECSQNRTIFRNYYHLIENIQI
jgi:hypothetical protein